MNAKRDELFVVCSWAKQLLSTRLVRECSCRHFSGAFHLTRIVGTLRAVTLQYIFNAVVNPSLKSPKINKTRKEYTHVAKVSALDTPCTSLEFYRMSCHCLSLYNLFL